MMNDLITLIITDALWFMVIAGWIALIVTGLEADKPLSGGIPGAVDPNEHGAQHWSSGDRIGEIGGWIVFATISALLPVVLYWIFAVHSR
jgi:hypothetical protein